jgi:predicted ATPase
MASLEPTNKPPEVEVPIYGEIIGTDTPIAEFKWDGKDRIQSLARINIFVGANNSGKSRALRAIFQSDLSYVTDLVTIKKIRDLASVIFEEIKNELDNKYEFIYPEDCYDALQKIVEFAYEFNKFDKTYIPEVNKLFSNAVQYCNHTMTYSSFKINLGDEDSLPVDEKKLRHEVFTNITDACNFSLI